MSRVLGRLLAIALIASMLAATTPLVAFADTAATIIDPPIPASIDAVSTPTTATPGMSDMDPSHTMDMSVELIDMQLHMELLSPEMQAMMSEMMGGTVATSSTAGAHDHSAHSGTAGLPHRYGASSATEKAVALSRSTHETGTVRSAVLVNMGQYSDTVAAAALAGMVRGPVLPTSSTAVSANVLSELKRLGVRRVYIVGRTNHVSQSVQSRLVSRGLAVSRLSGADRYATASSVARKIAVLGGRRTVGTVFVVNSDKPWDALTVSSYAYARRIPVLFVNGNGVPAATAKALVDLRVRRAIAVSSGISIKDSTWRSIASRTTGADTRLRADTRWALADKTARYAITSGWATTAHPVVANGTDAITDALIAGTHAGSKDSVLLLTPPAALPRVARVFLNEFQSGITHPVVVGTTSAVSDRVLVDMRWLLQGGTSH